jgi:hypothetical protein
MSPEHRRPDGSRQVGPTWESLVERQIREAMDEGAFNGLPHQGAPLPLEDDAAAGDWAMAHRMLRDAGAAPPWIEADKEARTRLAELDVVVERAARAELTDRPRLHREIVKLVEAANRAIERLNAEAPTDRQHRRLVDIDEVLRRVG